MRVLLFILVLDNGVFQVYLVPLEVGTVAAVVAALEHLVVAVELPIWVKVMLY